MPVVVALPGASREAADAPEAPLPFTRGLPFGSDNLIHGVNAPLSVISPISTPIWSPTVAVKVQVCVSPGDEIVPHSVAPLTSVPPVALQSTAAAATARRAGAVPTNSTVAAIAAATRQRTIVGRILVCAARLNPTGLVIEPPGQTPDGTG